MLVPIRCFTCNKVVRYKEYQKLSEGCDDKQAVFKEMGIKRYCCKRMYLTSVESLDEIGLYVNSLPDNVQVSEDYTTERIFEAI